MTRQEVIDQVRGKNLDTPLYKIRVFHISNPDYTYEFVRQEGSEVVVVDDNNDQPNSKARVKTFPADELVNVTVFQETLLDNEFPLSRSLRVLRSK